MRAQLKLITARNEEQRLVNKLTIIKELFKNGYKKEEIINISIFLDAIFVLSHERKLIYNEAVKAIEKEENVSLLTTFEEIGLERGIEQGIKIGLGKGESNLLVRQLEFKFQSIPQHYLDKINKANPDSLGKWAERVLYCKTLDQIFED